jgi:heat shock protein HslJ
LLASCGTTEQQAKSGNASQSTTVEISETNEGDPRLHDLWAIIQIGDKVLKNEDFPNGMPNFEINLTEGEISGTDGCNRFRGSIKATADSLIFGNLMSTQMACPNMDMSGLTGKTLGGNTFSYKLVKGKLLLSQDDSVVVIAKHFD